MRRRVVGCVRALDPHRTRKPPSTGPLAGKTTRITLQRQDGLGRDIVLLASNDKPSVGDVALLTVGCDRAFSTCRRKFGNAENFRGFPHLPGDDALIAGPAANGNDGGSRT